MCSAFPTCKGEAQGKWGKYLQHWRKCCCFLNTCSSVLSPSRGQYRMVLDNKHLPSKQHCSQPLLHSCIIHKLLCELQHAGKVLALCTKSSEHHFFFSWCAHKHIATSCMLFPVAEERQGQLFIRHRAHKRHTHAQEALKTRLLLKGHRAFSWLDTWGFCPGEADRLSSLFFSWKWDKLFFSIFF